MATLIVPALARDEEKRWPSLGDAVAGWLEDYAVYGPGPKLGQRVSVHEELYGFLLRAYQVFPKGHPRAGRRRFKRVHRMGAKGTWKTEEGLVIAQAEIHPSAPVRCAGWERRGSKWVPLGGPVPYPRLVFLAYSEEQVQRTAFGRFREALKRSSLAGDFHITQDRIVLLGDDGAAAGEAYPLAVSPDGADGDIPTWQHVDEPHRWTLPRHLETHTVVLENQAKVPDSDAWTYESGTPGIPGEGSVAELALEYARRIASGDLGGDPNLFFWYRFAPDKAPLDTVEAVEAAVRVARGPLADVSADIPTVVARYFEPKTDRAYWRRVWLAQWVQSAGQAFDVDRFRELARADARIDPGAFVVASFDGSVTRDMTALMLTEISTGLQVVAGRWQRPNELADGEEWEVDQAEVTATVATIFETYDVWRFYGDPFRWGPWLDAWAGTHGAQRVVRWDTTKQVQMAHACRAFDEAIKSGAISFDGDAQYIEHVANCHKRMVPHWIDVDSKSGRDGESASVQLWTIAKERPKSPLKIDLAVCGILGRRAQLDAIAAGAKPTVKRKAKVYSF